MNETIFFQTNLFKNGLNVQKNLPTHPPKRQFFVKRLATAKQFLEHWLIMSSDYNLTSVSAKKRGQDLMYSVFTFHAHEDDETYGL